MYENDEHDEINENDEHEEIEEHEIRKWWMWGECW